MKSAEEIATLFSNDCPHMPDWTKASCIVCVATLIRAAQAEAIEAAARVADERAAELQRQRRDLRAPDGAPALARSSDELEFIADEIRALAKGEP